METIPHATPACHTTPQSFHALRTVNKTQIGTLKTVIARVWNNSQGHKIYTAPTVFLLHQHRVSLSLSWNPPAPELGRCPPCPAAQHASVRAGPTPARQAMLGAPGEGRPLPRGDTSDGTEREARPGPPRTRAQRLPRPDPARPSPAGDAAAAPGASCSGGREGRTEGGKGGRRRPGGAAPAAPHKLYFLPSPVAAGAGSAGPERG